LILSAILMLAGGAVWAQTQMVPPLQELPSVGSAPWWQGFLTYREALRWFGGVVQALILALVFAHLAIYGYHHVRATGRMVRRYSWTEVLLHALLALSFVGAWASSTYLILGKNVLGYAEEEPAVPFGRLTSTAHISSGVLFLASLVALAVIWRPVMRFIPQDREWIRRLGGYFSRGHRILPAGKFNAGQKIWFRVSVLLGVLVSVSGALIYYPDLVGRRWDITLYVVHTALAVALSAMAVVHVYLGVLAHPRAARAMVTGHIDEACLREDHPLEPLPGAATPASRGR
jgi:formate dehydrogenase subunit gamma